MRRLIPWLALPLSLLALPQQYSVTSGKGNACVHEQGMDVELVSERVTLDTADFGLLKGEKLSCHGPRSSTLLIRSYGDEKSFIDGEIFSQVNLILANEHGIQFGPNAYLDVQNFIAAAGRISDFDFADGLLKFTGLRGDVINEGVIKSSGQVIFAGKHIVNSGTITADTILWENGGSLYMGSESDHMLVEVTRSYDEIDRSETCFRNDGSLHATKVIFGVGDPYMRALVQGPKGSITAGQVSIDLYAKADLAGKVHAEEVIFKGKELVTHNLQTTPHCKWDMNLVHLNWAGPMRARILRCQAEGDVAFGSLNVSEELKLEMQGGIFSTPGGFVAPYFDMNASSWIAGGDILVQGNLMAANVPIELVSKEDVKIESKSGKIELGRIEGEGQNLTIKSPKQVILNEKMTKLGDLKVVSEALISSSFIEAGHAEFTNMLFLKNSLRLNAQSALFKGAVFSPNNSDLTITAKGDVRAMEGFGIKSQPLGALIISSVDQLVVNGSVYGSQFEVGSAQKNIDVSGPVFLRGERDARTNKSYSLRLIAEGAIALHGDINTSEAPRCKLLNVGGDGGSVFIASKKGSVDVQNIVTSGTAGLKRGGNAGSITLRQGDLLHKGPEGTFVPEAFLRIHGEKLIAKGGSGALLGQDGDLVLGDAMPAFPDRINALATSSLHAVGKGLTLGCGGAFGVRKNLTLKLSGDMLGSDVVVCGDFYMRGQDVYVYPHPLGKITLPSGDIVAAGPTQAVVLGKADVQAGKLRVYNHPDYEALPVRKYSYHVGALPEQRHVIETLLFFEDGSMGIMPEKSYLQTMTPNMALLAPSPSLDGLFPQKPQLDNDLAAPLNILAKMINSMAFELGAQDQQLWSAIELEVMDSNPLEEPAINYEKRLRYNIFEPSRFVSNLNNYKKGRKALGFVTQVNDLISDIKELKTRQSKKLVAWIERFTQPEALTQSRWSGVREAALKRMKLNAKVRSLSKRRGERRL